VQNVDKNISPKFWKIINEFYKLTNLPMVLNTSFNRHGISTICSPRQALEHLLEGCVDILYLENFKIFFKKNRIEKRQTFKLEKDRILLKKQNIIWLKKNKKMMKKNSINKYLQFLKNI